MSRINNSDIYDLVMKEIAFTQRMIETKNNIPPLNTMVRISIHRCEKGVNGNKPIIKDIVAKQYYDDFFLAEVCVGKTKINECFNYIDFVDRFNSTSPRITYQNLSV